MSLTDKCKRLKRAVESKLGINCIRIVYRKEIIMAGMHLGGIKIRCPRWFEDRTKKSLEIFLNAFEIVKPEISKSISLYLCCGDYPEFLSKRNVFAYSRKEGQEHINLFPDFLFLTGKKQVSTTTSNVVAK